MFKILISIVAVSLVLWCGIAVSGAQDKKPKIPEHKCCHNGQCCGTKGCCTKTACISIKCPKIKKQSPFEKD